MSNEEFQDELENPEYSNQATSSENVSSDLSTLNNEILEQSDPNSSVEGKYIWGQFHLPSQKYLKIIDWITDNVTINDVLVPGYKVIAIKDRAGNICKARRNGKSYIALGGKRKWLRPLIYNGDRFVDISATHEIIVRAKEPRDLVDGKTACFLFATKWYTIDDLIAPKQGKIAVDYSNTNEGQTGVHQAVWSEEHKAYIDEYTWKKVVVHDGVQITKWELGKMPGIGGINIIINEHPSERENIWPVVPLPNVGIGWVDRPNHNKQEINFGGVIPKSWPDYALTSSTTRNQFCEALHAIESTNEWGPYGYGAINEHTRALWRYQFIWSIHRSDIKRVTGIHSYKEFVRDPGSQEKYMDYWIGTLKNNAEKIRTNLTQASKFSTEELLALCHFLGGKWAESYVKSWKMLDSQVAHNVSVETYLTTFKDALAVQKTSTNNADVAWK